MNATRAQFAAPAAGRMSLHTQRAAVASPLKAPLGLGRAVPARRSAVAVRATAEPQSAPTKHAWLSDEWKEDDRKNLRSVRGPGASAPAWEGGERRGRAPGLPSAGGACRPALTPKPTHTTSSPCRSLTLMPGSGTAAAGGTGAT